MGDEYGWQEGENGYYVITRNGVPMEAEKVVQMFHAAADIQTNVHQIKIFAGAVASRFKQEFADER